MASARWQWSTKSRLISAGLAIAIAAVAAWWWLPKWQTAQLSPEISDPKALADIENNFRATIRQLLGGAAVLFGAGLAYYQFTGQQQTSHNQLISQQVSKGFEQLGSDKLVVRLGGIYALEGVMNTSEQYRKPVLEALCAFVRDGTKLPVTTPAFVQDQLDQALDEAARSTTENSPATDIQAALTVIGRRANTTDHVDLRGANLGKVDLSDAKLSMADLSKANLSEANLSKANLSGADLTYADLTRAYLSGAELRGADLRGALLFDTNLTCANLTHANLTRAFLLNANLSRAILHWADLHNADLQMAKNVSQEQLNYACGDEKTKLPNGLTIKPCTG